MKRFFVELSYDGTNYHGWQMQINALSVQEVITDQFRKYFKQSDLDVTGCGRTDTGVHAIQFYLHFDNENILDFEQVLYSLNTMLPKDIALIRIIEVKSDAHARFDAVKRTYRYYINRSKDPFNNKYSWYLNKDLNIMTMNESCEILKEYSDFTSFSKLHTDVKTNLCKIEQAKWIEEKNRYIFEISSNRFLRNMVRSIVGTMVDIGMGKTSIDHFHHIIRAQDRSLAGKSVPGKGLFLYEVKYREETLVS